MKTTNAEINSCMQNDSHHQQFTEFFTTFQFIDVHGDICDVFKAVHHERVVGVGASGYLNIRHNSQGIQSQFHLDKHHSQSSRAKITASRAKITASQSSDAPDLEQFREQQWIFQNALHRLNKHPRQVEAVHAGAANLRHLAVHVGRQFGYVLVLQS